MGISNAKVVRLVSLLISGPDEFRDRVLMIVGSRLSRVTQRPPRYGVSDWQSVIARLSSLLGCDLDAVLNNAELAGVESSISRRMELLPKEAPFGMFHNGDLALARLCYGVVRALQPECVLETGVCYGVTSTFILAALHRNGKGSLHSIDLPPLGQDSDRFVGWAIADSSLKTRWHLHRGISKRILPELLRQIGRVDLFVHDSLHTYGNMRAEFDLVWPHLATGGVLIADDIQDNAAFQRFVECKHVAFHAALGELQKDSLLGILVKGT